MNYKKFLDLFEKTTFQQCLFFWLGLIFFFGILYYLLSYLPQHSLVDKNQSLPAGITGLATAEYFSFITALSVGYGDVTPRGISRLLSVIEAVTAMLFVGIIVSKLVSVKQEQILEEIYDMSFEERLNRLRSGLYLFRADANKVIDKVMLKQITKRQLMDLWLVTVTLDTSLHDIHKLLVSQKNEGANQRYLKNIDSLKLELLLNSIELSLAKLHDLLNILNAHNLDWRNTMTLESINSITNTTELIFSYYKNKNLEDIKVIQKLDAIRGVNNQMRELTAAINLHLAQQLNLNIFEKKD